MTGLTAELTPELALGAYTQGFFPMAESRGDRQVRWYSPDPRTILPIGDFHVSRSTRKLLHKHPFDVTFSTVFPDIIRACAEREETWINESIVELYSNLWRMGYAHSVECWRDGRLAGGLYGVSIGGAFFGESMFSRESNGSKIALVHLMARLKEAGYLLCDTQFMNSYLAQFGAIDMKRADYLALLDKALNASPNPSTRFLSVSPAIG